MYSGHPRMSISTARSMVDAAFFRLLVPSTVDVTENRPAFICLPSTVLVPTIENSSLSELFEETFSRVNTYFNPHEQTLVKNDHDTVLNKFIRKY